MFLSTASILILLSTCVGAKWTKWGQHEYKIYRGGLTQEDAEAKCNEQGGSLASIHSKAENDFLVRLSHGHGYLWIGLRRPDFKYKTEWIWTDGTPTNYFRWDYNQPDNWRNSEKCTWLSSTKKKE
ncbi:hypothetical protein GCK32_004216 [Trichostrongylus colubriformis]|uniref:C-type lectin domain-containing protein n=1 Tax=Trichostrongylus colubriformis TaxID=6319 RepID=A0AAN8G848_TRICO